MSTEAQPLSARAGGVFGKLGTDQGERVLFVFSWLDGGSTAATPEDRINGKRPRRVDRKPADTASETMTIPEHSSTAALKALLLRHGIEKVSVDLWIAHCLVLDRVCAAAEELGLEVHVRLRRTEIADPGVGSKDQEFVFELFRHPSNHFPGRLIKRLLDIIGAGIALLLASPVMLLAAVAIQVSSPGPVFFRQARIGRRFRIFRMIKFRTMVADAEARRMQVAHRNDAKGISFKVIDDPRLTRVGSILRRLSIDELPQLFNVLLGDMSLVGPRPIPTWVADQLCDTRYHRRFSVLPGMTGWWQVNGRRQDFDYMAERDLEYVSGWTVWLDLKVLAATPVAVLRGEGAH